MYNQGIGELYDLAETRRALQARRSELLAECTANSRLQQRFDEIANQISTNAGATGGVGGGSDGGSRGASRSGVVSTEPMRFPDVTFADVQSRRQGESSGDSEGTSERYSGSSTSGVDGSGDRQ